MTGAIDMNECPRGGGNRCRCALCARCGLHKHTALHGPIWGHKFEPVDRTEGEEYARSRLWRT